MFGKVSAHLRQRADQFMNGSLDDMVEAYRYPLPLYLGDRRVIVRSPQEARAILVLLRSALHARGVVSLQPKVSAIDIPRDGRFRVWVDWHELAISAEQTRMSSAINYCRMTDSGIQIEMITYTQVSMPELNPHLAALALSA